MMPDPDVLEPVSFRYYSMRHPPSGGWQGYDKPRGPYQLQADLNVAHDNIKKLVREKDLFKQYMDAQLKRERFWRKVITALVAGAWSTILYLIPYAIKGMAK
jgi:hypothetical protein